MSKEVAWRVNDFRRPGEYLIDLVRANDEEEAELERETLFETLLVMMCSVVRMIAARALEDRSHAVETWVRLYLLLVEVCAV